MRLALAVLCLVLGSAALAAQSPAPGLRLYAPDASFDTHLLDVDGNVVHTWRGRATPARAAYLDAEGTLTRVSYVPGAPFTWAGGDLRRIAFDGTVLWDFRLANTENWAHHDIEVLPNGNVLIIAWDLMSAAEAIAAGRDPALISSANWLPDAIFEVVQTGPTSGVVGWEWHLMDHVIQDRDPTKPNYGVVADHPELVDINFPPTVLTDGDWTHCNSVGYDPLNDIVILNSPRLGEFYFIDHSTTTAEAAGHTGGNYGIGGDILYRWGNPQTYGRGTAGDQQLDGQHSAYIIPQGLAGAGNVLVFNNMAGQVAGQSYSSVVEIALPVTFAAPPAGVPYGPPVVAWEYVASPPASFYSRIISSARRLPNGNTLICSGVQRRFFEVDPGGQIVWEAPRPIPLAPGFIFQVNYYERYLWADRRTLSASTGGSVGYDLVAGTRNAGAVYVMLGSASGTNPGFTVRGARLPLNPDGYTLATMSLAGSSTLPTFVGVLDGSGNGRASFALPPLPGLAGITLHHAYVVLPTTGVSLASNAEPLRFVR